MTSRRIILAALLALAMYAAQAARPAAAHEGISEDALAHVHFTQDACTLVAAEALAAGAQIGGDEAELRAGEYAVSTYYVDAAGDAWYEVLAGDEAAQDSDDDAGGFLWVDGAAAGYTVSPGCLAFFALAQAADAQMGETMDEHMGAAGGDDHAHGAHDADDHAAHMEAHLDAQAGRAADDGTDGGIDDDASDVDDAADDDAGDAEVGGHMHDHAGDGHAAVMDEHMDDHMGGVAGDADDAGDAVDDVDDVDDAVGDGDRPGARAAAPQVRSWEEGGCLLLDAAEDAPWHARPGARAGGALLGGDYFALELRPIGGEMWFLVVAPEAAGPRGAGSAEVWVKASEGGFSLEVSCLATPFREGSTGD